MNIHPVNHAKNDKNRYCGPAAISILTGMNTGEAARLLRHITGKPWIMGTDTSDVIAALHKCGLKARNITPKKERISDPKWSLGYRDEWPTLAAWLRDTVAMRSAGRVFLLVARNHWQVISGRRYVCGQTGKIISITDKGCKRRARVTEVFEITQPGKITVPAVARKPATKPVDPSRAALLALEKRHGFKGRLEWDGGWRDYVVKPCAVFPRGLSTQHHDWWETFDRVDGAIDNYEFVVDEDGHLSR